MAVFDTKTMVTIMCPRCGKFLTRASKKDDSIHKLKHDKCGKWIWYNPATGYREAKEVPMRNTASGVRFY